MSTEVRKVISVAELHFPPFPGDEEERKWRGVAYEDGSFEYFLGSEYYDWDPVVVVPNPVKICLDFSLAWRALDNPEDFE